MEIFTGIKHICKFVYKNSMAIIIRMLVNEKGYLFWGLYRNRKNIQPDWLGPFFNSFAYTIFTVHISFDTVIVYWLMFSHITNPFYNGLVLWDLCKEPCELENVTHRDTFFFFNLLALKVPIGMKHFISLHNTSLTALQWIVLMCTV